MTLPTLSEAMRLGTMLKPQARRALISEDGKATCALGAALDAVGRIRILSRIEAFYLIPVAEETYCPTPFGLLVYSDSRTLWPILNKNVRNPETGLYTDLQSVIMNLNDSFLWSRERIADWVQTIEEAAHAKSETSKLVEVGR